MMGQLNSARVGMDQYLFSTRKMLQVFPAKDRRLKFHPLKNLSIATCKLKWKYKKFDILLYFLDKCSR